MEFEVTRDNPREGQLPRTQVLQDVVHGLRGWYFTKRRILPWREQPTAYRVWVSEIMLQQTQVVTVIPYFERFIARFPDVEALATASLDELLEYWQGLGYYRRARLLHRAAQEVVDTWESRFPSHPEDLKNLPGIGPYTAGAIASIAFGRKAALVDGNVARVLSRLFMMEDPINERSGEKQLWALAEELLEYVEDPSSHNQALMELGALVCTPKSPSCDICPLRDRCEAYRLSKVSALPVKLKKVKVKAMYLASALVVHPKSKEVLWAQRQGNLWSGLWEFPSVEYGHGEKPENALITMGRELWGIELIPQKRLSFQRHQLTHRSVRHALYQVEVPEDHMAHLLRKVENSEGPWLWADLMQRDLAVSSLIEKVRAHLASAGYS